MKAIPGRPHVQGSARSIELATTSEQLTDAAGLVAVRAAWDGLGMGSYLDRALAGVGGRYRPSLHIEQWISLLLYGGQCMDHLPLLESRGVRALYGWSEVVDPTTFGRFLRRGGELAAGVVDKLLLEAVRARWAAAGRVPGVVMLMFDSQVVQRYGQKQAGAEKGYNPQKRGRPSHHPLLAFLDTGDCLGVRWRPGSANTAAGFEEWVEELVKWLREQGVERILVRLDKGFFKASHIEKLLELKVDFVMKMQESNTLQQYKGAFSCSVEDRRLEVARGERWGAQMLCVRERARAPEGELDLGPVVLKQQVTILSNIAGLEPLDAWRMYNQGAQVEHRIEEIGQLGVGRTAVNDIGGNRLLWSLGALAYQLLHLVRSSARQQFRGREQVKTLRTLVIRTPGKLVWHARRMCLKLMERDPLARLLGRVLERLRWLKPVPLPAG